MEQDDDNQNLVLGILFGIIALVIGLVIGLTVYVTGQNTAAKPVAKVVAKLAEDGAKIVLISGYHDETGGAAVNAEVAKARAGAVKDALLAAGVPADKLAMRKPAVTLGGGDAAEARRVEVRVQ